MPRTKSEVEMHQTSIRLPESDHLALSHVAMVNRRDVAEEVREAIRQYLDRLRADPEFLALEEREVARVRELFHGSVA